MKVREHPVLVLSDAAAADLSTHQHKLVKLASGIALCGAGEAALGVLQNDPVSGQAADVLVMGVSRCIAGAAVTAGAKVMSDAAGKAITATSTNQACGVALTAAAADGDLISILVTGRTEELA